MHCAVEAVLLTCLQCLNYLHRGSFTTPPSPVSTPLSCNLTPCPPAPLPQYCNLGTLRQAAKRGVFRHRMSAGAAGVVRVDMAALLEVALQVAEAVSYLHSIRICHCDIKVGFMRMAVCGCVDVSGCVHVRMCVRT